MTVEQLKTEADKLGYQLRRKGSKREYVNSENPDGTPVCVASILIFAKDKGGEK